MNHYRSFQIKFLVLLLLPFFSCEKTPSESNSQETQRITDFTQPDALKIESTFPDTLTSGDTLIAKIFLGNKEWEIKRAFSYCPIGTDSIFRIYQRTITECQEFPVVNGVVDIWFVTVGEGAKLFDLVTLVIENGNGELKATELQLEYFLKK